MMFKMSKMFLGIFFFENIDLLINQEKLETFLAPF